MFLILLRYDRGTAPVDLWRDDHLAWLRNGFRSGILLLAGRREPRDGGVILCRSPDLAAARALAASDPFVRHGAASHEIVEFVPGLWAEGLEPFLEPRP